MGISIGMVGLGSFGSAFAKLFKAHPAVDRIALCDIDPEKIRKFAEDPFFADKFSPRDAYLSLDEICKSDVDALVIITQHWLHAPQCVRAMEAGKHVYSAVPLVTLPCMDEILDWCDRIIETSGRTGMRYMLGETTCFYPEIMFCRRMAEQGRFGEFVYSEGEYCHDVDSADNLRRVMQIRYGSDSGAGWPRQLADYRSRNIWSGPMDYPTHSAAGPVYVMKTHAEKVTAYGFTAKDPFFHDHTQKFSNEFALYKMANGTTVRLAETREAAGQLGNHEVAFRLMGTHGTFSENRWYEVKREGDYSQRYRSVELDEKELYDPLPPEVHNEFKTVLGEKAGGVGAGDFIPSGHRGAHPYMVHEFIDALVHDRLPVINAWEAARYTAMGVTAHKSALKDGETLTVPDWGDAPQ
ncbi:MAG: Gfo/Idh/MocA family oxidoreductase [Victivallaceae bacterium]|nr:Gfo/Idh/MocA family oxidoreductase [Victivallaceae bacterium]